MCDLFRLKFDFEEGAQLKFEFDGKMELCKHTLTALISYGMSLYTAYKSIYSQTCIKRSPLGQRKSGLIRQVTS